MARPIGAIWDAEQTGLIATNIVSKMRVKRSPNLKWSCLFRHRCVNTPGSTQEHPTVVSELIDLFSVSVHPFLGKCHGWTGSEGLWGTADTIQGTLLLRLATSVSGFGAWMNNCIHLKQWHTITHTFPNFKDASVKPPLKLWHGWIITS